MSDEKATRTLSAYERAVASEMLMEAKSRYDRAIHARRVERLAEQARQQEAFCDALAAHPTICQPGPPDAAPAMIGVGTWRLYFNRHGATGLPWCVAPDGGGWELAVASVDVRVPSATAYAPKATPDDEDGRPSAWISCAGRLTITAGVAAIATP